MRRILLALASAAALASGANAQSLLQAGPVPMYHGTDPTTREPCRVPSLFYDSDAPSGQRVLACEGTTFAAFDSDLAAIAALSTTAFGRGLLDDTDAAAHRTAVGLVIGTDVQAFDADLSDLADGILTGSKVGGFTANRCIRSGAGGALEVHSGDCGSGGGGGGPAVDLGDNAVDEIASGSWLRLNTVNDNAGVAAIFTEPLADEVLIDLGIPWPGGAVSYLCMTATSAACAFISVTPTTLFDPNEDGTTDWSLTSTTLRLIGDKLIEFEGATNNTSDSQLGATDPTGVGNQRYNLPNAGVAGTYTLAALSLAQSWSGIQTFSVAPILPAGTITAINQLAAGIREGSGTKLLTGTEGSDLLTVETLSSANTVRFLVTNPGAGGVALETEAHPTDGGTLRAYEGADDGANFFGFRVPNSGLALDRECTIEDDAHPIPQSCVGTGVDDDVPEAVDLGALTAGNGLSSPATGTLDANVGLGLRLTGDAIALDSTAALSGDHALNANECKFGASGLICEGATADNVETYVAFTDPVTSDRTMTIPNASSVAVIPQTCGGTDKVSAVSAGGVITCSADQTSAGSNDSIRVEDGDDGGTYTAATDADFGDSGDVNAVLNTTPSPDEITFTIRADAVALTTDTTGDYLASLTAGTGIAVTGGTGEGAAPTAALDYSDAGTDPGLGADECRFSNEGGSAGGLVCEGATADANETRIRIADPTAERIVTVPDASGAILLDSNTATVTGKSLDAEGTGNVVTLPLPIQLDAAGCNNGTAASFWDLPPSSPAVAACRTGTNVQGGTLDFADGASLTAQRWIRLPTGWTGNVDAVVDWQSSATSGDVVWQIAIACAGDGDSDDPAFTDDLFAADTTKGTGNLQNDTVSNVVTTTGTCAAGDRARVRIKRDSADAGDTMAGTARLMGVHLTVRVGF